MPLICASEPKDLAAYAHQSLQGRLGELDTANVKELRVGRPLPIYGMQGFSISGDAGALAGAYQKGWCLPIQEGRRPGIATIWGVSHAYEYGGTSFDEFASRLFRAAVLAEQSLHEVEITLEPRLLSLPMIHFSALWLAGKNNLFVTLAHPRTTSRLRLTLDEDPVHTLLDAVARHSKMEDN